MQKHCECLTYCLHDRHQIQVFALTGHHPNCRNCPDLYGAALDLLGALVDGIEAWADEADGIVPDCLREQYRRAARACGKKGGLE